MIPENAPSPIDDTRAKIASKPSESTFVSANAYSPTENSLDPPTVTVSRAVQFAKNSSGIDVTDGSAIDVNCVSL